MRAIGPNAEREFKAIRDRKLKELDDKDIQLENENGEGMPFEEYNSEMERINNEFKIELQNYYENQAREALRAKGILR